MIYASITPIFHITDNEVAHYYMTLQCLQYAHGPTFNSAYSYFILSHSHIPGYFYLIQEIVAYIDATLTILIPSTKRNYMSNCLRCHPQRVSQFSYILLT